MMTLAIQTIQAMRIGMQAGSTKKAEKKRVMKGGVESVDSSDSDSEQPVKNAD